MFIHTHMYLYKQGIKCNTVKKLVYIFEDRLNSNI